MLKANKSHKKPDWDDRKHGAMREYGREDEFDYIHDLIPSEIGSKFIKEFEHYVKRCDEVICALLIGSYAREEANDDSDVDILMIVADTQKCRNKKELFQHFGKIATIVEETKTITDIKRVYYATGLEVEFGYISNEHIKGKVSNELLEIVKDGYKILKGTIDINERQVKR